MPAWPWRRSAWAAWATSRYTPLTIGGAGLARASPCGPTIPAVSCMASQYAGWAISVGKFFAMGSGPLRAHARVEHELFEKLGYEEEARRAACWCSRAGPCPPTRWPRGWPRRRGSSRRQLTFVVAPTASLAGGVQISARILETGLHKMETLGFDVRRVVSGMGTAPIPPVAKNDLRAIGRTNDCILYGGQARYTVRAGDARAGRAGRQGAGVGLARLRHAVLRHLPALRGRLLQDRPAALQPGGGLADEHRDRAAPSTPGTLNPDVLDASLLPRAVRSLPQSRGAMPCDVFPSWWLVPSLALSAACSKPADKARRDAARRHRPGREAAAPAAARRRS